MTTQRKRRYGWRKPRLPMRAKRFTVPAHIAANLPSSVDLRPNMPPVVDQGDLGSCTANSVAGAIGHDQIAQGLPVQPASRLFIYYNERVHDGDVREDAGSSVQESVATLADQGWCAETEWPYVVARFKQKPTAQCYSDAVGNRISDYASVAQTADALKGALAAGKGVCIGFTVYESFESNAVAATGIMPLPGSNEEVLGGHAVLLSGYDDSQQAFLVRNSWGTGWGIGGYFWMPYAFALDEQYASDFWVVNTIPGASSKARLTLAAGTYCLAGATLITVQ